MTPLPAWLAEARLAYGCMNVCGTWKAPAADPLRPILAAFEAGFRVFDHADIYAAGRCEEAFAAAGAACPALRREAFLVTKAGHVFPAWDSGIPHHYDTRGEHLEHAVEGSLRRLGVEHVHLFLIHRPDPLLDPGEVAAACARLHAAGKVGAFGVSNFSPLQLDALAAAGVPVVANQIELHAGLVGPFLDGTLDHALARGWRPMAWGCLARGLVASGGTLPAEHADAGQLGAVQAALDALAQRLGCTRSQAALAFLMRHPSRILPVVGSTDPGRIAECAGAARVALDRLDWYRVHLAARGAALP